MRNCQICNSTEREMLVPVYDGRKDMSLFECGDCGHRYVDGPDLSQAGFDQYYRTTYRTTDDPFSATRWDNLAKYVRKNCDGAILDIGGKDGRLVDYFRGTNYTAIGQDDYPIAGVYDCVILSHVLEHVYAIDNLFLAIVKALNAGGLLVIEVPFHNEHYKHPDKYDVHFQHINKFRPRDLTALLAKNGYAVVEYRQLQDFREYKCWRIVGKMI